MRRLVAQLARTNDILMIGVFFAAFGLGQRPPMLWNDAVQSVGQLRLGGTAVYDLFATAIGFWRTVETSLSSPRLAECTMVVGADPRRPGSRRRPGMKMSQILHE